MNGTRRGLNRTLLGVFGLVLIGLGGLAVLAGSNQDFAKSWTRNGTELWASIQQQLAAARIPGQGYSWWTVAVLGLALVAAILLVCWIASQGGGRTNQLARHDGDPGTSTAGTTTAGTTTVETAVAGQAIKAALAGNSQVLATTVQSWRVRGGNGLKISLQARKGASPRELTAVLDDLVEGLDVLLGEEIPVLIRIRAGTRTRFARTERVA
ncbi:hypothetical protein AL755_02105 (plasmid) [Arthrobacter sp. ERGS1:01]|uniref:hypothetical protein n=1 Tax=Arthrobacter sp. ERGS1:01 TaxID=1704044 RepID=UPI0006B61836|nr:hypothetical protein [Arthrobacter sp. ERGS1:01]ALE04492.1 hypothetical protein AL755_02105 [Arthrobacter sp. ERGS1:01]